MLTKILRINYKKQSNKWLKEIKQVENHNTTRETTTHYLPAHRVPSSIGYMLTRVNFLIEKIYRRKKTLELSVHAASVVIVKESKGEQGKESIG